MKAFGVKKVINAKPETIWKILTDAAAYPEWDPGMKKIEGEIALGNKLKIFTKMSPRVFSSRVTEFVPNEEMTWTGGLPMDFFKGVRTFKLSKKHSGGTTFVMRECFSGVLFPFIIKSIPDLKPVFEDFADALKNRAEALEQD